SARCSRSAFSIASARSLACALTRLTPIVPQTHGELRSRRTSTVLSGRGRNVTRNRQYATSAPRMRLVARLPLLSSTSQSPTSVTVKPSSRATRRTVAAVVIASRFVSREIPGITIPGEGSRCFLHRLAILIDGTGGDEDHALRIEIL